MLYGQSSNPDLKLSTATGQTTFHIGERIPLLLSFTGPDDKFIISLRNYDRSGRLTLEEFSVLPSNGWADPLAQYFAFTGSIGGGIYSTGTLSSKPITRSENLNEWIRFDAVGAYTVTVTSHRVSHLKKKGYSSPEDGFALKSNSLEIKIIPASPQWQKATLDRIVHELALSRAPDAEISPVRRAAIEDLRYLASPGAIAVLAANLRDDRPDFRPDAFFGIVGLPRSLRDTALTAMNRLIDDPTFPVSISFLEAIPMLEMEDSPLPSGETAREVYEAHSAKAQALLDAAWQATATALPRKVEPARAQTAQTLTEKTPVNASPASIAQIGSVIRSSFSGLSRESQTRLLVDQWEIIRSRELLPQLRQLSQLPAGGPEPNTLDASSLHDLRAAALKRWFEFEPEDATREIVHQVGSATPALSGEDLYFLPSQTFPQFEGVWAKAFSAGSNPLESDVLGSLLIRFGTGTAIAQIIPLTTRPTPDFSCNRQIDALAYVVRFDPEAAKPILAHASDHPSEVTLCYGAPLNSVSKFVQDPVLTEAAIRAVSSPYPNVVEDGLRYLTKFGDKTARQPILDRYLKWSGRWTDKPEKPAGEEEAREDSDDRQLGDELARALLANQGWIPDAALTATVLQHCFGKYMCETVARLSKEDFDISASQSPYGTDYHVGSCDIPSLRLFEAKLDQFPEGTTFTLVHTMSGFPGEQRSIEDSLPVLLAKHGMKLRAVAP